MNAPPMVDIVDVRKRFGATTVLNGIDLEVERGSVVCILGPSGSGKSTLLRCINHLETIDGGSIRVAGNLIGYREHKGRLYELTERQAASQRADIGMVFQAFNLFPHLSVLQNVMLAPTVVRRLKRDEVERRAREGLARVGLADKADAYPDQLSGGQQQRAAIARALAMRPQLMLFDEPTSALDPELVGEVLDVIRQLADDGMTMVVVTHEIGFARDVADRIVFMDGGVIVEEGPADEVLLRPQTARAQDFLAKVR